MTVNQKSTRAVKGDDEPESIGSFTLVENSPPNEVENEPASGWIKFAESMPHEPHGKLLVTNNLAAVDSSGMMSHLWLVGMVHAHDDGPNVFGGRVLAEQGEITAYAHPGPHPGDMPLRNLTHWRPAVPEEWGS